MIITLTLDERETEIFEIVQGYYSKKYGKMPRTGLFRMLMMKEYKAITVPLDVSKLTPVQRLIHKAQELKDERGEK